MQIGVTVANNWGVADFGQVAALGELAEELGFDSIWTMDHLFNVGYIRDRLEDRPYYHPLATLSFLAARTRRILLGTSVLVLPYHNPVELAKYAATLDQMSGGRLVLGVGAGGLAEEFEALGVPFRQRGSLTNESMRLMKELWTNPRPAFQGRRWRFRDVLFSPRPLQQPHIPLWVGGASEGARRRAALLGDGWHPIGLAPEQFAAGCEEIRSLARQSGRDDQALTMSVRLNLDPSEERHGRGLPARDTARLLDVLAAYERAGAGHALLALESGDVAALESAMRLLATQVLPPARAGLTA